MPSEPNPNKWSIPAYHWWKTQAWKGTHPQHSHSGILLYVPAGNTVPNTGCSLAAVAQHQMIKMPLNTELYIVQQHNIRDLYALHHQTWKTPAVCTRLTCAQHRAHPSLLPAPGSNPSCCWLAKQHKPGTEQQMEKGNADSSAWPAHRGAQTALAMYI